MAVRTVVAEVTVGRERGLRYEGEQGSIGTATNNALTLTDDTVSRYHLGFAAVRDGIKLTDLGSTNGTFVQGVRLQEGVVPPGSSIRLGQTQVTLGAGVPALVELFDQDRLGGLRGRSSGMRRLMDQVRRVGQSSASVLLSGESGTGKELLARAIHDHSPRAQAPFVTMDCGAITPNLIASELFGHEKGAFTGAASARVGAFERANGGTLFLDEIGELPVELQVSLLGALERQAFTRVGGNHSVKVDVRIVSATNRDLRTEINQGLFRLDLYYRLAVVVLEVPPLRERADDLTLLIDHFLQQEGSVWTATTLLPRETLDRLKRYPWPGNVRELKNYVLATLAMGEAAVLATEPKTQNLDALDQAFSALAERPYAAARSELLQRFEQMYATRLLERTDGNVAKAARESGMARSHLNELLRRYGLR